MGWLGANSMMELIFRAAKAREVLGCLPDRILVEASGNIIKNVKSVVVPNTGGLKGIEAAAAAGAVAGDAGKILEVISAVTDEQKVEIRNYLSGHAWAIPSPAMAQLYASCRSTMGRTSSTSMVSTKRPPKRLLRGGQRRLRCRRRDCLPPRRRAAGGSPYAGQRTYSFIPWIKTVSR